MVAGTLNAYKLSTQTNPLTHFTQRMLRNFSKTDQNKDNNLLTKVLRSSKKFIYASLNVIVSKRKIFKMQ
jgi:hypothetical protein